MTDILVRMLDDSFHEFDRLMEKALDEVAGHAALAADYATLLVQRDTIRAAGAAFVVEAAMALRDAAGDLSPLPRRPFLRAAAASAGIPPGRSN